MSDGPALPEFTMPVAPEEMAPKALLAQQDDVAAGTVARQFQAIEDFLQQVGRTVSPTGPIVFSPDGTRWQVTVDDAGVITAVAL
jgi:hypothetical protein